MVANIGNYEEIKDGFYLSTDAQIYHLKKQENFIKIENYAEAVMLDNLQSFEEKLLFIDISKNTLKLMVLDLEALVKNCEKNSRIKK